MVYPKKKNSDIKKIFYFYLVIFIIILVIFINNHYKLPYKSINYRLNSSDYSLLFDEPIQPIPLKLELNKDKIKLGNRLFSDPRLSQDNTISCASCHNLNTGGTDQMPRSIGIKNRIGLINTPTVWVHLIFVKKLLVVLQGGLIFRLVARVWRTR
ncbi:MAG: hypothetical protein F6K55_13825 [Moorea sp. SIO4A3]|nr:hypothetical protein [Moorena sp. SIO4A3]